MAEECSFTCGGSAQVSCGSVHHVCTQHAVATAIRSRQYAAALFDSMSHIACGTLQPLFGDRVDLAGRAANWPWPFLPGRYSVDCTFTDEEEVARQISAAMCGGVVDGSAVRPGHTAIRPLIRPRAIDRIEFMAESSHRHHRDRGRRQTSTNSNCRRARNVRSRR